MTNRSLPRLLQAPAVLLLLVWMLVPLSITLYFSFIRYVLNSLRKPEWTKPGLSNWRGFGNYEFVLNNKDFIYQGDQKRNRYTEAQKAARQAGRRDAASAV